MLLTLVYLLFALILYVMSSLLYISILAHINKLPKKIFLIRTEIEDLQNVVRAIYELLRFPLRPHVALL